MDGHGRFDHLKRARRLPWTLGLVVVVAWPLALEILLRRLPVAPPSSPGAVEVIGQGFTGLVFLAAAYLFWRVRRARGGLADLPMEARCASLRRETWAAVAVLALCSLIGPAYHALAGRTGERHARSFLAAVPVMFFAFTPRLSAWEPSRPGHPRGRA